VKRAQIVEGYSTTAAINRMRRQMSGVVSPSSPAGPVSSVRTSSARLPRIPIYDVVVCDRLREAELGKWRNLAKHPIADFVSPDHMFEWLERRAHEVCAVIHMGAVSSTMEQDADTSSTPTSPCRATCIRWCAEHQRRLIYASSAATYGAAERLRRRRQLTRRAWRPCGR
jgi:nucleoside-diphosphate-sugar epimerase